VPCVFSSAMAAGCSSTSSAVWNLDAVMKRVGVCGSWDPARADRSAMLGTLRRETVPAGGLNLDDARWPVQSGDHSTTPERNGLGKGNLTKRPARRRQMAGRPPDCARGLPNLWVSRGADVPELRIETLAA
jgi:hypothetical protein